MNVSLAILLGLTGAFSWGAADFAARFASRRVGAYRTLFFMQFFGFLALSAYLKWTIGFSGVAPGWRPWAMAIAAGILNMVGSLALYHSFEIGTMSIVGPVSSSYPALTVALSLLSGERIHMLRAAGLAVTLVGVILAATSFAPQAKSATAVAPEGSAAAAGGETAHAHLSKGVSWAIFAALAFGVMFWFLGFYVVPLVGSAVSVWVMRLTALVSLAVVAAPVGQSIRLPRGGVWWLLLAVGVLDTAAFVANNAGLSTGQVSVVSVLASLYGAVTVLLSWIFLRERLERSQWLGIVLIFAGVVMVSI